MFKLSYVILLCLGLSYCIQEKELLRNVINEKISQFPKMRDLVNNFFPKNIPNSENYVRGNGFTKFSQSDDIIKFEGVPHDSLRDFLAYLVDLLRVKQDNREQVAKSLYLTRYAKFRSLVEHNLMYDIGGGECKYSTILGITNRDTKTTDWFVSDIKLTFSLAPDLLILRETTSYLGGLFESTKTSIREIPKNLTEEQMVTLGTYFQLITYQGFHNILDISFRRNLRYLP